MRLETVAQAALRACVRSMLQCMSCAELAAIADKPVMQVDYSYGLVVIVDKRVM